MKTITFLNNDFYFRWDGGGTQITELFFFVVLQVSVITVPF